MADPKNVTPQTPAANLVGSIPKVQELDENALVRVNGGISTEFTRKERLPNSPATLNKNPETAMS